MILGLGMVMVPKDNSEEDRELAADHHQETFDADVLSSSGLEELEFTLETFMKARRRRMVMIALMSPGTSIMLIM